jgi:alginate O-acetyltransferase complex protein AlgJ
MYAEGAGLPDQLALEFGFPIDVVAVRGSGATPARRNLARRKDNLAGKKLVIWCFTSREFTEGEGWDKVQVIKPNPVQ